MSKRFSFSFPCVVLCSLAFLNLPALARTISPEINEEEIQKSAEIHWLRVHTPPISMVNGPYAGKGLLDGVLDTLTTETKSHQHQKIRINVSRLFAMLKNNEYCVPGLVKTPEREKFLHFSQNPTAVIDASQVIYSSTNLLLRAALTEDTSLRSLLNKGFRLGVGNNISYGKQTDKLIKEPKYSKQVHTHHVPEFVSPLLNMVHNGRLDFILAPPWVFNWVNYQRNHEKGFQVGQNFLMSPYTESDRKIPYYAACSKTNTGQQNVHIIDSVLQQDHIQDRLEELSRQWMEPDKHLATQ